MFPGTMPWRGSRVQTKRARFVAYRPRDAQALQLEALVRNGTHRTSRQLVFIGLRAFCRLSLCVLFHRSRKRNSVHTQLQLRSIFCHVTRATARFRFNKEAVTPRIKQQLFGYAPRTLVRLNRRWTSQSTRQSHHGRCSSQRRHRVGHIVGKLPAACPLRPESKDRGADATASQLPHNLHDAHADRRFWWVKRRHDDTVSWCHTVS